MTKPTFSIAGRVRSFGYAFSGLGFMLRTQHNAWIHLVATLGVCLTALLLGFSPWEWLGVLTAIALVWIAETTNTAFEYLCDVVSPEHNSSVQRAKDIAAGAVLISSAAAVAIGGILLWAHFHD